MKKLIRKDITVLNIFCWLKEFHFNKLIYLFWFSRGFHPICAPRFFSLSVHTIHNLYCNLISSIYASLIIKALLTTKHVVIAEANRTMVLCVFNVVAASTSPTQHPPPLSVTVSSIFRHTPPVKECKIVMTLPLSMINAF